MTGRNDATWMLLALGALGVAATGWGCGGAASPSAGAAEETTSADYAAGGEAEAVEGGAEAMPMVQLSAEDQALLDDYDEEAVSLSDDFGAAIELAEPDCDRAGELRDAICDLAERICDIADRHPEHGDVVNKCGDGQDRCERATEDVESSCG